MPIVASTTDALQRIARAMSGLRMLLLFGSRARDDAHPLSDWDFGYLADEPFDHSGLLAAIVEAVGSDRVDLVDPRASAGCCAYRAARDGQMVFEARPHLGERFRLDAVQFWCDTEPVLRRAYEDVLAGLTE